MAAAPVPRVAIIGKPARLGENLDQALRRDGDRCDFGMDDLGEIARGVLAGNPTGHQQNDLALPGGHRDRFSDPAKPANHVGRIDCQGYGAGKRNVARRRDRVDDRGRLGRAERRCLGECRDRRGCCK